VARLRSKRMGLLRPHNLTRAEPRAYVLDYPTYLGSAPHRFATKRVPILVTCDVNFAGCAGSIVGGQCQVESERAFAVFQLSRPENICCTQNIQPEVSFEARIRST
jgi:hypothetical protein